MAVIILGENTKRSHMYAGSIVLLYLNTQSKSAF